MKEYIYPQNLKATSNIWMWSLRDFVILIISTLISVLAVVHAKTLMPGVATLVFAFLAMRFDEVTVIDFIKIATKYFITSQQYYEWR